MTLLILGREDAIALVNVDPNVVHENSSFPFFVSLRSAELLSSYLTHFSSAFPARLGIDLFSLLGKPCHGKNVSFTRLKSDLAEFELSNVGLKSVELNAHEQVVNVGSPC